MTPPFVLRRRVDDPVWARLRDLLRNPAWEPPAPLETLETAELAALTDLDEEVVAGHPIAGESDLLRDLTAMRGIDLDAVIDGDPAHTREAQSLYDVMRAWLDLWGDEDSLPGEDRVTRVGLERDFEEWLLADVNRLGPFGFPVVLVGDQVRFADGCRGDVLCRAVIDSEVVRRGDLVMIENKAHRADGEALEQLLRYVRRCRQEWVEGAEDVHGLLLADGITVRLQERLRVDGVHYVSLSALGYRDHLRGSPPAPDVAEPDEPLVDTVAVETLAPARRRPAREVAATAGSAAGRRGPWTVAGVSHRNRRQANRALAAELGTYTSEQWREAQRRHGLR